VIKIASISPWLISGAQMLNSTAGNKSEHASNKLFLHKLMP
jgi:hypothetical protein